MVALRKFKEGAIEVLVATDVALADLISQVLHTYTTSTCLKILKATFTVSEERAVQEKQVWR